MSFSPAFSLFIVSQNTSIKSQGGAEEVWSLFMNARTKFLHNIAQHKNISVLFCVYFSLDQSG